MDSQKQKENRKDLETEEEEIEAELKQGEFMGLKQKLNTIYHKEN